ncbi:RNA 2',3'-cyclic phosphodiesterase [Pseudomonas cavernicola]|uniref:RNA 2',3'-cyclic phosphodiesterase n=1 Tax=Pseudomonas cavernicola TaxID=2320866 RepID=A0A418XAX5_9PSED|nr:RNA 2',3'-cyclic phosphodiesterase [Pseudomonas cavernicola]RJG09624.1 RNA 2',3'-cyclic phosphodiesterase [Pseudomonas cavernicola]
MSTPPLHLFFALACPPDLARNITAWRDDLQLDGRPVAASNLHLTLAFLGSQPRGRLGDLKALAAGLQAPAFNLQLDSLCRWRNGLLYLAPSQPPAALLALAQRLRDDLLSAGFSLESRPFHVHLTLTRRCPLFPADANPSFDWPVSEFALFASENTARGTHYRLLERWQLHPNGSAVVSPRNSRSSLQGP